MTDHTHETLAVETIERWLQPGFRPVLDRLDGALSANATSITLEFGSQLSRGDSISIGLEDYHVWSYNSGTKVVTVEPAQHGSTSATHADDSKIWIRPRFSPWQVAKAINDEILSWGDEIYRVSSDSFTTRAGQPLLALDATFNVDVPIFGLVDARVATGDVTNQLETPYRYSSWRRAKRPRMVRGLSTTDYPYGALHLGEIPGFAGTVYATFALGFDMDTFPATSNNLLTTNYGLTESQQELAALGAAVRLTQGLDTARLDRSAQGEPRRAEEVPLTAASQIAGNLLRSIYVRRYQMEVRKLNDIFPIRIS